MRMRHMQLAICFLYLSSRCVVCAAPRQRRDSQRFVIGEVAENFSCALAQGSQAVLEAPGQHRDGRRRVLAEVA